MRIQRRLASVTAVSAVTLFGLTGCGGDLGPELHPGTAATVGDSSISISTVDDKSEQLCRFGVETGQLEGAVPMASVRSSYVQAYVDHQLAEQYVEHIDAQDDPALTEQVKEARSGLAAQLEQVPSALRPIFEDMASMSSYIEIVQSIGGEDYEKWAAGVDVQRDPRFPALDDQGRVTTANQLSVPVSDLARAAVSAESQQEYDAYLASLPQSQKCGTPPDA
ncbi:MAG TPA: hypothetical protein VIR30_06340 [Nocardioides sp.]